MSVNIYNDTQGTLTRVDGIASLTTSITSVNLNDVSWTLDNGKYYANPNQTFGTEILSATVNDWANLELTDNVVPMIQGNTLKLMSNTNTFPTNARILFKILYR